GNMERKKCSECSNISAFNLRTPSFQINMCKVCLNKFLEQFKNLTICEFLDDDIRETTSLTNSVKEIVKNIEKFANLYFL
ncbi:MAG: hypothetical protein ACK42K_08865, partial [Leptonema sp. (in: bacteria)]